MGDGVAALVVAAAQLGGPGGRFAVWRTGWPDGRVVRPVEAGVVVDKRRGVAAFVEEAMVVAAQQDEVVEAGGAAVGPEGDVVGVDVACGAAGKGAARAVSEAAP